MSQSLTIHMAQINYHVGDIDGNVERICAAAHQAAGQGGDVLVCTELAVTGYPPEDLLLRPSLTLRVEKALQRIAEASHDIAIVVGYPWQQDGKLYNAAGFFWQGQCMGQYFKQELPNYQVFDEKRYFSAGSEPQVINFKGHRIGLTVCEDIWFDTPMDASVAAGAELIVNLNASPFHQNKRGERQQQVGRHATRHQCPVLYVNQVGGQDELVFDGHSFAIDQQGRCAVQLPGWREMVASVVWDGQTLSAGASCSIGPDSNEPDSNESEWSEPEWNKSEPSESELSELYSALVLGVRDYVNKNRFPGVVLGLSGGIDSALTLAIAVDALGAERVKAVMMPFTYTSDMSKSDAEQQARSMGVRYESISIEPMYREFMQALAPAFAGADVDTTEENLQSRCRGVLLMAMSNKTGAMVLTTGNKSEMAVGYATLYGDMAGGYGALKDVYKTKVFALARYRNSLGEVIPERVITRPPSAELAPDQKDEDSLPAYEVLDDILQRYIENDDSADDIIRAGFDAEVVHRVLRLVDINEYKRRQAPIGVRVTRRGFGRDRRYPVTNGWRPGL
ncbi:NAD+ synthase [Bacterioplanes sanyensis]|uniref:Glutamine-dependent NAD(+) synthetase n=1 Tax=Bacterioplanes sanyensis TaxID=1249553 RepID=A0A222FIQ1_9GAMM|nr:NAD+ synthase [Bacterioplanes sanyensis]ASP38927.1 NAD+ synthase [Bacterioplanes sanyensis]